MSTRQLARFVHRSRWTDLPEIVRREAVRAFLNWVGCAHGGADHPAVERALRAARTLSASTACTVVGRPERLDPPGAALVNGLGRALPVPMPFAKRTLADITESMDRGWAERDCRAVMLLAQERAGVSIAVDRRLIAAVLRQDPAAPTDTRHGIAASNT